MKLLLTLALLTTLLLPALGQENKEVLSYDDEFDVTELIPVSELEFKGFYANRENADKRISYWIFGFNGLHGGNERNLPLIDEWLDKHPDAVYKPVSYAKSSNKGSENSEMLYGWVIDGKENMNLFLVEQGGCKSNVMLKMIVYDEMPEDEKKKYSWLTEKDMRTLIPDQEYQKFLKKLYRAERKAQKKKLGLWAEEGN